MQIMDFIRDLNCQSLQEIMRGIVISLGWDYIVLWSLDQQAQELACKNGWFNPVIATESSTEQSVDGQTLFNLYKLGRFALDAGVPGLSLNQLPYVWLTANELLRFSSNESQEEFYKAAGIQTALFIPCGNGVVELGSTNLVQAADEQNILRISSLMGSLMVLPNISVTTSMPGSSISTSSCSSLLSRSILHSPERSSMVSYLQYPTITTSDQMISNIVPQNTYQYSMSATELASGFYPYLQTLQLSPSSSQIFMSGHDQYNETTLAVYPGNSSHQINNVSNMLLFPQSSQASGFPVAPLAKNMMLSAFGIWKPPSKVQTPPVVLEGQYTLKRCLTIVRNIHEGRLGQVSMFGSYRQPGEKDSSSQVHHMISERRRREKLKEGFEALRSFFPPGTMKDKASILGYTREYLTSLKSRVEVLEQRNKQLESELNKFTRSRAQSEKGAGTSTALQQQQAGSTSAEGCDCVVTVEASKRGGSGTGNACDEMEIEVVVDRPTNTIDSMIALLKGLTEMRVPLISMATSTAHPHPDNDPQRLQFRMSATIKLKDEELEGVKEGLVSALKKDGGPLPQQRARSKVNC